MKTLKSILVATLVAVTMVGLSNTDGFKIKPKPLKVVNVSFEKAIQCPGLVKAMYEQIDKEELLSNGTLNKYVAEVTYSGTLYRITGTRAQWIWFFRIKIDLPYNDDPGIHSN
ncbi:MAG TPA: hypothetical protein PLW31_08505 [Bacteroidales bacterium]|jgi:hypothetical protein|nr:hypothetical protein [Bacteroidales bacterium]MDX9905199.1 hypothetical protein [Bacteroidales bacterium]HNQ83022.1 hypothetical protein [Bacteroidales bacterium]HOX78068.1 hypothetical protein [Bacteroidales bacterium]HPI86645.1 hypothetical protein [Bacteroidales bacterium]